MRSVLTIAIPLHGGRRWLDTVVENVAKAPSNSTVVISDASGLDDAPEYLERRFAGDDRVTVVRRTRRLGWIEHSNLLLAEATTEYFCWMPQDDLVSPEDYFDLLVAAMEQNPDRVLAFPSVLRRVRQGRLRGREVTMPFRRPPFELGRRTPEAEALDLLRRWNIGLGCWRGVFRRSVARPIPETRDSADLAWAFSMALAGHFIEVPEARYLKRLHRGSALTQMRWEGKEHAKRIYVAEIRARMDGAPERQAAVMQSVEGHLARHRHVRAIGRARAAAAYVIAGRRPIFE